MRTKIAESRFTHNGNDGHPDTTALSWAEYLNYRVRNGKYVELDGVLVANYGSTKVAYACANGTLKVTVKAKQPGKYREVYIKPGAVFQLAVFEGS
jgi:translation initiation factor IF-1